MTTTQDGAWHGAADFLEWATLDELGETYDMAIAALDMVLLDMCLEEYTRRGLDVQ